MPHPFKTLAPNYNEAVQFGNSSGLNFITPKSAIHAYVVISTWAQVEYSQLRFFVEVEGGPQEETAQRYFAASSQREKSKLISASTTKLSAPILGHLDGIDSKIPRLERFRNKIAHWQPCSSPLKPHGISLRNPKLGKSPSKDGLRSVFFFPDDEMEEYILSMRHAESAYFALCLSVQYETENDTEKTEQMLEMCQTYISAIDLPRQTNPAKIMTGFGGIY